MIRLIKNLFSKKKEHQPHTKGINNFVLNRQIDRIHSWDYSFERFDKNDFYKLNIDTGLIIFIDLTDDKGIENYINENYAVLKDSIELKGRTFVKNVKAIEKPYEKLDVSYFYPYLKEVTFEDSEDLTETILLNYIGYAGNIKTGFLSFYKSGASFVGLKKDECIEEFVKGYIENLQVQHYVTERTFYSINKSTNDDEPNIEIDKETSLILNQIEDNLLKLKQSGQFFLLAPKLEHIVKLIFSREENLDLVQSELYISNEFRIFLPQYQGIEIKLSHLTKAIYFLFLRHPEGILLSDLYKHENELLVIYKAISYQISFDKMENSVRELITNDKAIFVHFSRIKSAFIQKFTDAYARFYYIQGEKGKPKSIKLPASKIYFEKEI